MEHHAPSHLNHSTNRALNSPILVVGFYSWKLESLTAQATIILLGSGCENSIIAVILLYLNATLIAAQLFPNVFIHNFFSCAKENLICNFYEAGSMIIVNCVSNKFLVFAFFTKIILQTTGRSGYILVSWDTLTRFSFMNHPSFAIGTFLWNGDVCATDSCSRHPTGFTDQNVTSASPWKLCA